MSTPPGGPPPYGSGSNDPNESPYNYGSSYPQGGQPPYGSQPGYGQYPPQGGGYGQPGMPGQNHPRAVTSMVLGIIGVVCCSLTAPFALFMGKKAVTEIDASGGRMGGRGQAQAGFILGIIGSVLLVLGILWFILAIALGSFSFEAGTTS